MGKYTDAYNKFLGERKEQPIVKLQTVREQTFGALGLKTPEALPLRTIPRVPSTPITPIITPTRAREQAPIIQSARQPVASPFNDSILSKASPASSITPRNLEKERFQSDINATKSALKKAYEFAFTPPALKGELAERENITDASLQSSVQLGALKAFVPKTLLGKPGEVLGASIKRGEEAGVKGLKVGELGGRLAGTAAQYMTVSKAIAPLIKTTGLTGAKAFAAKQGADLLVDNIVQLPGEVIDSIRNDQSIGQDAKDIAIRNVIDIGFNAVVGIPEMVKLYKTAKAKGVANEVLQGAVDSLPDATKKTIQQELGLEEGVTAQSFLKDQEQVAKEIETEQIFKQFETDPIKDFTAWRSKNFGGATGQVAEGDMTALKQLYKEDTGIDLDVAIKEFQDLTPQAPLTPQVKPLEVPQPKTVAEEFRAEQGLAPSPFKVEPANIETPGTNVTRETLEIDVQPVIKETPQGGPVAIGDVKERGFSRNVRTDEAMEKQVRESFETVNENYNALGNKEVLESAQTRFNKGYEEALQDLELTKHQFRSDNVPLSRLIANEAANRGDMLTARRVITDVADTLTTAGQYSQAAKILRETNDPATVLSYVLKELDKLNGQGLKRYGEARKGLLGGEKGWNNIELIDSELEIINRMTKETSDVDKKQMFEDLFESIQSRIPTSKREKFDAWRRISMLFNPKTHVRNVVGNTMMGGIKKLADTVAATGEKLIPLDKRTKSVFVNKELKQVANKYWDANNKQLTEGSRWEIFGVKSPFSDKRIFDTEWLESLNNISKKTLEAEDVVFMKHHFTNDLANFMKARGIKEPTQEAADFALRRAQEATFRESNALAEMITKGKQSKYGIILEASIPFSKTPANILKTGLDYSPAGVGKAIYQLLDKAPPEVFIETMSKGLTGTGLATMGYFMSKNGLARGEYKSKGKEEAVEQLGGSLPNSVKMPNGSYTVDWAQPGSMPFFMGVAFQESMERTNGSITDAGFDSLIAGGDSLVNASMLRGIKELFGGSYGSTTEKIAELPFNYVSQAVPTVAGQISRSIDPIKRERDYSGIIPKLKTQTQAKIPGLSQQLSPKRGLLGEELTYGKGALNVLQQFLSPGYVATASQEPVAREIVRLYESQGSDFVPRSRVKRITDNKISYDFTPQEISDFQKVMGEYTKDKIEIELRSQAYKNKTDDKKADRIKDINQFGYELAKQDFLKKRGIK